MYIRHVDKDEQKIEMWLHPELPKVVEQQMGHVLAGIFITLKSVACLSEQDAMDEMSRLAHYLIAYAEDRSISPATPPPQD